MTYIFVVFITIIPLFVIEEDIIRINNKTKVVNFCLFYSIVIFIVLGILRTEDTGIDLKVYHYYYSNNFRSFEIGYSTLMDLFRLFSIDFSEFISVLSVFLPLSTGIIISLISKKKWISILLFQTLYLYVSSFSLLRQFIAMSFVLIAVWMIKKSLNDVKTKWFYLLASVAFILIGSLFHYSALAMFILPIVSLIERKYYLIIIYSIIGFVLFFFRNPLIQLMLNTFFPTKKYYANFQPEIGIFSVLQFGIIMFNQFLYRIKSREDEFSAQEREYLFVTNLSIIWFITLFVFSWFPNLARITMYISMIMVVYLPNFMKYKKTTYVMIIIVLVIYYAFALIYRDYQGVYPYQWILGMKL